MSRSRAATSTWLASSKDVTHRVPSEADLTVLGPGEAHEHLVKAVRATDIEHHHARQGRRRRSSRKTDRQLVALLRELEGEEAPRRAAGEEPPRPVEASGGRSGERRARARLVARYVVQRTPARGSPRAPGGARPAVVSTTPASRSCAKATRPGPRGIVVRGRVALRLRVPERGPTTILTVEPGDIVGWSAVVPPHRATYTVVALIPTELLLLDGAELRAELEADPVARRGRLPVAARGAGPPADRHPPAAAGPLLASRERTVVTAVIEAPGFLPRADLDRLLDLLRRTAVGSSARPSSVGAIVYDEIHHARTCRSAGPTSRRRAATGSPRPARTAASTTRSARPPGSARRSRPACR